jgi:hypothetical protein
VVAVAAAVVEVLLVAVVLLVEVLQVPGEALRSSL